MAQLQRMDAHLDTLTTELYQVNTHVSHIAKRQAHLSDFVESASPSTEASKDEDNDDDSDNDVDATVDEDDSSFGDDEMISSQ